MIKDASKAAQAHWGIENGKRNGKGKWKGIKMACELESGFSVRKWVRAGQCHWVKISRDSLSLSILT